MFGSTHAYIGIKPRPWQGNNTVRNAYMNNALLKLYIQIKTLAMCDDGQDLVEYALVVGLISVAAVSGLGLAATSINNVISKITSSLTSAA